MVAEPGAAGREREEWRGGGDVAVHACGIRRMLGRRGAQRRCGEMAGAVSAADTELVFDAV